MSLRETYQAFIAKRQAGLKADARRLADELVALYAANPDITFVYEICEASGGTLDFVVWRDIVLPELRKRIHDQPDAIRAMIATIQRAYSTKAIWKQLDYMTEEQLTIRLLQMVPDDPWAKARRVDQLQQWLRYTVHAWPAGVLYGANGATDAECEEILTAIEELRRLDAPGQFRALCSDVQDKTEQYRARRRG